MPFPIPPADLDGERILLIGVVMPAARAACFVSGTARYTGSELRVHGAAERPAVAAGSGAALQGFDPAVLPHLIVRHHRDMVLARAAGVTACVVAAVPEGLAGAIVLDQPFFGLAMNGTTGEIFLMQGDDSEDDYADETVSDHDPAT